jgi:hypothetical protein
MRILPITFGTLSLLAPTACAPESVTWDFCSGHSPSVVGWSPTGPFDVGYDRTGDFDFTLVDQKACNATPSSERT